MALSRAVSSRGGVGLPEISWPTLHVHRRIEPVPVTHALHSPHSLRDALASSISNLLRRFTASRSKSLIAIWPAVMLMGWRRMSLSRGRHNCLPWVHQVHDIGPSRHASGEPPPIILPIAVRSGSTPRSSRAAVVASVGDDFIEHQKRSIGLCPVAHRGQKFWFDRIHADTVGHGVQQNAGPLLGMFFEQFESTMVLLKEE